MTILADRTDGLLDLAAQALATDRLDLMPIEDIRSIFHLAVEVLEPAVSDLDAEIVQLKQQLADAQASIAWLKRNNEELRATQVVVLPGDQQVRDHIRMKMAKAVGR